jgi:serine protease Do
MSTRRSTWFYGVLIVLASVMVGMVLASRLDLTARSAAQTLSAPAANSAPLNGPVDASTFRNIAKAVTPTVVNIRTESRQRAEDLSDFFGGGGGGGDLDDLFPFRRPGGGGGNGGGGRAPQQPREEKVRAAGTGFIIEKTGLILTNNHVVDGANKIMVSLYGEDDDQEYPAKIVGQDPLTDSALIELTEKPNHQLPEIKFGDSSQMQPGDWVMAIGNPFGFSHTVSVGVVSGIGREFAIGEHRNQRVIQTDAAINPGNSGGPLLNLRGEVIGINTAIYADQARQGNIGIGFAMPINLVRDVLPQLRTGKITRGRIGIELKDVAPGDVKALNLKSREGALVSSVIEDSAAEKAGVEDGDVILSFNAKPIHRSDDLVSMVTSTKPGTTVPLRVIRKGAERSVNITVDELDYNQENQAKPRERAAATAPPDDHETSRGFGLELQNVNAELARRFQLKDTHGAIVTDVDVDGSAAGILFPRDVIVEIGSAAITTAADASRELGRVPSGGTVTMRVMREGRRRFLTLVKE